MARSDLPAFRRFCAALRIEQGGPMLLEPFQLAMLRDYFAGARETLILLAKKNYKTTTLAALALFHLLVTEDAECVVGATSREQAGIMYDQAHGFVRRSPGLEERVSVKRGYREIRSRRDAGRIRVLAADADTADGVIPTLALVDELHRARSAGLYAVFRDGLGPRDGQMLTISTAGDHELSPLGQMRTAARNLPDRRRRGRHLHARSSDGSYAYHEWALDDDDDEHDMRTVKLANPAAMQTLELLAERHASPSTQPWQWARFACNKWVSAEAWWLDPDRWRAAATSARLEDHDRITIGFDGARRGDATALIGCRVDDGLIQPLAVWEPPVDDQGRPLPEWETPAGEVDAAIADAFDRYTVVRGYFDPPLWQSEVDEWARTYGDEVVFRFSTARTRMMAATERFRTDMPAHTGDELLTRHALNAQVREVRGGYWLAKGGADSPNKIDAAVAAVLAYEARCDALAEAEQERPRQLLTF
ncbi:MAG TPA: terminase large subunit [Solirubrobacteraceae bacterium]|nr:terminase large subunit [Solirubrobacteraceae bacterium]